VNDRALTDERSFDMAAMYVLASTLHALILSGWTLPGEFAVQTAGSAFASTLDNLPSDVIVHDGAGLGPSSAILALSIAANLFLTGSVGGDRDRPAPRSRVVTIAHPHAAEAQGRNLQVAVIEPPMLNRSPL
jgi:hypothetical protein